jgi:hypothetical protein
VGSLFFTTKFSFWSLPFYLLARGLAARYFKSLHEGHEENPADFFGTKITPGYAAKERQNP